MDIKQYLAEFIGTALLVLLGNGVVANVVLPKTKGNGSGWIVITFGWGMAVFVAVWCVGPISGAHLNPAVTVGLAIAEKFSWDWCRASLLRSCWAASWARRSCFCCIEIITSLRTIRTRSWRRLPPGRRFAISRAIWRARSLAHLC